MLNLVISAVSMSKSPCLMLQLPVKIPGVGIMRLNAFRLCWRTVYVCVVSASFDRHISSVCAVLTLPQPMMCRPKMLHRCQA